MSEIRTLRRTVGVTQAALAERGIDIQTLDFSEIRKGDGSLTCMSVWF